MFLAHLVSLLPPRPSGRRPLPYQTMKRETHLLRWVPHGSFHYWLHINLCSSSMTQVRH